LDGGAANLGVTDGAKQLAKPVDGFIEERSKGFWRAVATGETGAAGGDDRVNLGVGYPG